MSSNTKVNIQDLAAEINKQLEEYNQKVTDNIKNNVDKVSDECNKEIKAHITFRKRTGKYIRSFRIKKSYKENKYNKTNVWYVAGSQARLTHLLEKGHAFKNGGRAKAYPHIIYGETLAKARLVELVKESVEHAAD